MRVYLLLVLLLLCLNVETFAADSLWTFTREKEVVVDGLRKIIPEKYAFVFLNDTLFKQLQPSIPSEVSGKSLSLEIPSPDGTLKIFQVWEATTMEPELAERYPQLKTYSAYAKEHKEITAKLDYTASGFHAMVLDGENTYFIDPYSDKNTGYYISYYNKNYNISPDKRPKELPVHKKCCKAHKCRRK